MMRRVLFYLTLVLTLSNASLAQGFELNLDLDKLKNAFSRAKDLKPVDDRGELEIGDGVAANLLGAVPLVQDETLQHYVNRLGLWLALQTERPDLTWHFGVLDTDSVNAFAAPGGYVFITRGLLLRLQSEAELAGVLAHEIGHVLKRHHLNAIQKNAQAGILADLASIAADQRKHGELAQKAISTGTELYSRGLDKDDEYEADRLGVVIAARAGYDPYGLPAVLQTLGAMNPQDGTLALMFKTHPAPQQRLQLLDGLMSGKLEVYASQPNVQDRFRKVVGDYLSRRR